MSPVIMVSQAVILCSFQSPHVL